MENGVNYVIAIRSFTVQSHYYMVNATTDGAAEALLEAIISGLYFTSNSSGDGV